MTAPRAARQSIQPIAAPVTASAATPATTSASPSVAARREPPARSRSPQRAVGGAEVLPEPEEADLRRRVPAVSTQS